MSRFAAQTETPIGATEAELRKTILRYGGDDVAIAQSAARRQALVQFHYRGLTIEMRVALPDPSLARFTLTPSAHKKRSAPEAAREWDRACRQQWRVLLLLVKAKLEAVENGIPAEQEFLNWILLPCGQTLGSKLQPRLKELLASGEVRGLLYEGPPAHS